MKKINKTEKIEIRIDSTTKKAFLEYAKQINSNVSTILRNFIKECVKNAGSN